MKLKEILNKLEEIEGSLDDAFYSLPEYNANSDSRYYIDSARNELYVLKENVVEIVSELNTEEDTA
jgi:ADP-dependent phosphofructokinase/glucokinase